MGRAAGGVMAIRLTGHDQVAGMDVVDPARDLLVVTARGYAKRTPLSEYSLQGRYGSGVTTLSRSGLAVTGHIVSAQVVSGDDEIALISADGMVLRTQVRNIAQLSRATRGSTVMRMRPGDSVAAVALLTPKEIKSPPEATTATSLAVESSESPDGDEAPMSSPADAADVPDASTVPDEP
jgi:DNA gyrase subunit A